MLALSSFTTGLLAGSSLPASATLRVQRVNVQANLATALKTKVKGVVAPIVPPPPEGFIWLKGYEGSHVTKDPGYAAPIAPPPPPSDPLDVLDFGSYDTTTTTITEEEVLTAQANWVKAITTISATHAEGGDFVGMAGAAAGELYGYGHTNVLFKPTKATDHPFRATGEEAMSYFVGAEAMGADEFKGEDAGFAINGGRGWSDVVFRNHQIDLMGESAVAMGDYVFTDATSGDKVRVEYTFGYRKNADGKCRIFLHHSSVPYTPAGPAPVTVAEVTEAQELWANSIASISKVYAEKGDYVAAAGEAAGKLYGYGHGNVLFKPTKATDHPFRATGEEAMSYFVGAEAMGADEFKGEDAGFAINGGRGWKSVTFRNHQIETHGNVAHAMGDYVFVDATSGDEVRVEYTFGYKRCEDGKARICLHHSSVPYKA